MVSQPVHSSDAYEPLEISYSRVAGLYAAAIYAELKDKPLDRQLLDRLADRLRGRGVICDLGCGPGQVARYLHEQGCETIGVDAASGMVAQAQQLNPDLSFRQGNLLALDVPDGAWAGITAFYSLIHISRVDMMQAMTELHRVLRSEGLLLIAFHIGTETIHLDEWWEQPVDLDFYFFEPHEMIAYLQAAAFVIEEVIERDPYPDIEHQSRRCYILAQKTKG